MSFCCNGPVKVHSSFLLNEKKNKLFDMGRKTYVFEKIIFNFYQILFCFYYISVY